MDIMKITVKNEVKTMYGQDVTTLSKEELIRCISILSQMMDQNFKDHQNHIRFMRKLRETAGRDQGFSFF